MDKKYILYSGARTAKFTRLIAKCVDMFLVLLLAAFFYPLGLILGIAYICVADGLNDGQSVGKKVMGFAVLSLEDGMPCSMRQSLIRNLPLSVPLFFAIIPLWGWILSALFATILVVMEVYFILRLDSNHRLGDVMADTTVIANDAKKVDLKKGKDSWFDNSKVISM